MLSFFYYVFSVLFCTISLLLSAVALVLCAPFDRARRVVHEISRVLVKVLFRMLVWGGCRVEGAENMRRGGRYVVVMNHQAMMDIPILYFLPLNFRWVSKREVFNIPFIGVFLLLHGDIAIERGSGAQAMERVLRDGCKWLSRGVSVAIFPEGTRSRSGEIGRFKAGAFTLAREAGVEILPVVIDGTRDVVGKGGRLNWRSRLTMRVLPPVKVEGAADCRAEMDYVRGEMCRALTEIRMESK